MKKLLALTAVVVSTFAMAGVAQAETGGQRNALAAAQNYLDTMPFLKSGLIKQLKFEHYSSADASWAAAHVHVSWNAEAVQAAKQYLETMSFSRSGLVGQLEFDGFTHAQASYGVSKAYH
jgi:hypothetical protein